MDPFTMQSLYAILLTYIFLFAPVYAIYIICDIFRKLLSEEYRLELCHMNLSGLSSDDDEYDAIGAIGAIDDLYDTGSPASKPKNQ